MFQKIAVVPFSERQRRGDPAAHHRVVRLERHGFPHKKRRYNCDKPDQPEQNINRNRSFAHRPDDNDSRQQACNDNRYRPMPVEQRARGYPEQHACRRKYRLAAIDDSFDRHRIDPYPFFVLHNDSLAQKEQQGNPRFFSIARAKFFQKVAFSNIDYYNRIGKIAKLPIQDDRMVIYGVFN